MEYDETDGKEHPGHDVAENREDRDHSEEELGEPGRHHGHGDVAHAQIFGKARENDAGWILVKEGDLGSHYALQHMVV